jgi:hypothetical protein
VGAIQVSEPDGIEKGNVLPPCNGMAILSLSVEVVGLPPCLSRKIDLISILGCR